MYQREDNGQSSSKTRNWHKREKQNPEGLQRSVKVALKFGEVSKCMSNRLKCVADYLALSSEHSDLRDLAR